METLYHITLPSLTKIGPATFDRPLQTDARMDIAHFKIPPLQTDARMDIAHFKIPLR